MSPIRIMLVDDEVVIRLELQNHLQEMGYEICAVAASGEQAMNLAEQARPDLVLMDITIIGEQDGIDTARQLRVRLNVPTIFLTAHADPATLERAKEAEPFGYLVKPVDPLELRATVEMALARIYLENEREELIAKLHQSLAQVKLLSGLLPICANCKKIRDDKGYWNQVEEYVSEHSEARFSHGICPECIKKLYPEYAEELLNGNRP